MVKREGKIEKEILLLGGLALAVIVGIEWRKRYKIAQQKAALSQSKLDLSASNFSNASGPRDNLRGYFGRTASNPNVEHGNIRGRVAHPDYDRIPRSKIESVVNSQSELSRLMGSVKSKGIQVPEQELTNVFNQYEEALKNGRQMPPRTIDVPNAQGKWTVSIWWRWPPGITIKYEF